MLIATKREVDAIADLLMAGDSSPQDLAKAVIRKVTELREERKVHALVFGLGPGVHMGFGPFATVDAAFNSVDKNPMAYIAKRAAVVPILGSSQTQAMRALADEPPTERSEFNVVREDALATKRGWRGNVRDRDKFLQPQT